MSYLLDTNVISELVRAKPSVQVIKWFDTVPNEALYISVLTLGEIRKGVEMIPEEKRKEKLRIWLEIDLPQWFSERVLPISKEISDRWGRLQAEIKKPFPAIDSLIAATALYHDLRIVTRNTKDFNYAGLQVVSPWEV